MTQEDKLDLILSEMTTIKTDLKEVKSDLQNVKTELQTVKTQQDEHSKVLHALTTDLSGVKTQLEEHGQILQAVLHNQEVANAEIEGIKLTMATSESVRTIDAKFDLLNTRLFHQEAELVKLKCVK